MKTKKSIISVLGFVAAAMTYQLTLFVGSMVKPQTAVNAQTGCSLNCRTEASCSFGDVGCQACIAQPGQIGTCGC